MLQVGALGGSEPWQLMIPGLYARVHAPIVESCFRVLEQGGLR